MSAMEYGNLAYLVLLGAVIVFWFFIQNRQGLNKTLQQGAVWGLIFLGVIAAVGLWGDIRQTVQPQQLVMSETGRIEVPRGPDGHYYLTLEINGVEDTVEATGDGPVDATFNAIKALVAHEASLQLYQVHAVTQGTDAQAEVSVRLEEGGKTVVGQGADTDTLVASARAYVNALNKLITRREKTAPSSLSI